MNQNTIKSYNLTNHLFISFSTIINNMSLNFTIFQKLVPQLYNLYSNICVTFSSLIINYFKQL